MTEISATLVKELRDATNVGMMECKKALQESGGDKDKAIKILRERGVAVASKKSSRVAKEGAVAATLSSDLQRGAMVEVNCESDFAARTPYFRELVGLVGAKALVAGDGNLAESVGGELTAKIAQIGENIVLRRNVFFRVEGSGLICSYIHLGGKVGVLVEIGVERESTSKDPAFLEAVKDITLHIAASSPQFLQREDVPSSVVANEREIYAKQVVNKPVNIVEKIVTGKLDKFYNQICLLEQPFVKDQEKSVSAWMADIGKKWSDNVTVRRFVRYQLGEEV